MGGVSTGLWRMKPPLESVWRDGAEPMPTDPLELDERARALAAERLGFDLEFGPLLARLQRHRVWWEFRCGSWDEYVTEWLGLSVRTVRQKLWLERRMIELPEIRAALRSWKLTYTKALFVAKDATPEDVAERIAFAASTTARPPIPETLSVRIFCSASSSRSKTLRRTTRIIPSRANRNFRPPSFAITSATVHLLMAWVGLYAGA